MNPVLALMETDSFDAFANDVANAYFQNPTHVRSLLNADCIESCVDYVMNNQRVEFDLSDLDLFEEEVLFSKPSRQRGKRKHSKKEVRRKGSTKRFRDRSRKCASEGHMYKVYNRGLVGDWGRRGRRLEEAKAVSTTNSHKIVRDIVVDQAPEEETETRTFTYLYDGFALSMSMSKSAWEKEEEDDFSPSFNWDRKYTPEWDFAENPPTKPSDKEWLDWEDVWGNDDDEIIGADCTQKQDTAEFSAVELASIATRIANADPAQRARIRSFMATI